jgi:zinc transport system substrate-binding protein
MKHECLTVGLCVLWLGAAAHAAEPGPAPLRVVASFHPMAVATLNVVGQTPGVTVVSLAREQTGCLHDYQMTTEDMVTLASADVFVINGAGMEAFLDKATRQAPRMKVVDASRGIALRRDDGEPNAHVWVSVLRHIRQVANIANGLAAADPARAAVYLENAAAYTNRLGDLHRRMQAGLAGLRSREIVTFHEAFPYFAEEFNLRIVAVIAREPGSEPSGREMAETIRAVRRTGVKALFAEPQYSPKVAATLARETGATVHWLDPVVTGPLRPDAYIEAMEKNLAVLQQALQ